MVYSFKVMIRTLHKTTEEIIDRVDATCSLTMSKDKQCIELSRILVSATINRIIHGISSTDEKQYACSLPHFLGELNSLRQSYLHLNSPTCIAPEEEMTSDTLVSIFKEPKLDSIALLNEDKTISFKVDPPQEFESCLKTFASESAHAYSMLLVGRLEELKSRQSEQPINGAQTEPINSQHNPHPDQVILVKDEYPTQDASPAQNLAQESKPSTLPNSAENPLTIDVSDNEADRAQTAVTRDDIIEIDDDEPESDPRPQPDALNHNIEVVSDTRRELDLGQQDAKEHLVTARNPLPQSPAQTQSAQFPTTTKRKLSETPDFSAPPDSNEMACQVQDEPVAADALQKQSTASHTSMQQQKRFQSIATSLITRIQEHRFSLPFLQPVNKRDAADYADVIYEPRDLKNILRLVKSKIEPPAYTCIKHLERDIMLMFANCIMYNKSDDELTRLTLSMRDDVQNMFKMYEDAELDIS